MKKKIIAGLVILSVATVGLMACGPKGERGFGDKPKIAKILKQLDLSDTQKESLKALRSSQKDQRKAFKEQMRAKNSDLASSFSESGFDKTTFVNNATQRFQTIINNKAEFMGKVYDILDENQRKEFVNVLHDK